MGSPSALADAVSKLRGGGSDKYNDAEKKQPAAAGVVQAAVRTLRPPNRTLDIVEEGA